MCKARTRNRGDGPASAHDVWWEVGFGKPHPNQTMALSFLVPAWMCSGFWVSPRGEENQPCSERKRGSQSKQVTGPAVSLVVPLSGFLSGAPGPCLFLFPGTPVAGMLPVTCGRTSSSSSDFSPTDHHPPPSMPASPLCSDLPPAWDTHYLAESFS